MKPGGFIKRKGSSYYGHVKVNAKQPIKTLVHDGHPEFKYETTD